jgi:hypothetical protein
MKKVLVIGALAGVFLLALGAAGLAYAQARAPQAPAGFGSMAGYGYGYGGRGFGMMVDGETSPVHEYMTDALAEALGITPEEFVSRREAGETLWQIAESLGISSDDLSTLIADARAEALDQAVQDGVITQEQADWMNQRMGPGFGPGAGHCDGTGPGGFGGRGRGWRGNYP